mgnify:CR=1 FL=1
MLSAQDNEILTRTSAGTPMGELFRRFWTPVLLVAWLVPDSWLAVRPLLIGILVLLPLLVALGGLLAPLEGVWSWARRLLPVKGRS